MKVREVAYSVTYDRKRQRRYVWIGGKLAGSIKKREGQWYAGSKYHKTLRDAIIFLAYGV